MCVGDIRIVYCFDTDTLVVMYFVNHGGNQQQQQGELPVGKQSGGGNPLLDMVKGAGSSQKGGSGTGGGGSKAEFGANAGSV